MSDVAVVGLSILGAGTLVSLVFFAVAWARARTSRGWTRVQGVVVNRRTGLPDGGLPALYPTFSWQDANGTTHQRTSSMRQSLAPPPGRAVPILYDPDNPDRAIIDTYVQSGRVFWLIGSITLVFSVLIGGVLLYGAIRWG